MWDRGSTSCSKVGLDVKNACLYKPSMLSNYLSQMWRWLIYMVSGRHCINNTSDLLREKEEENRLK